MTSSPIFFDTNILLYAIDKTEAKKNKVAKEVLIDFWRKNNAIVSTQVLSEFAAVGIKKLKIPLTEIREYLRIFQSLKVHLLSIENIFRALEFVEQYKISFWDAQILSAAESTEAEIVYSEDLNPGQQYGNVKVINPFTAI